MNSVKDLVFRQYGDEGADTLEKHWAQIEYTGYLCSRMLLPRSGILGIIPEGIEDVCIVHDDLIELHQVKCRDETQPPWTIAEVLPILCKLYNHRLAFEQSCEYHFVSDLVADSKTQFRPGVSFGPLTKLKQMLDIKHSGFLYTEQEEIEFREIENVIASKIANILEENYSENVGGAFAKELLARSWIETSSKHIRNHFNYQELAELMYQAFPGQVGLSVSQLHDFYVRILLLIVGKIKSGRTIVDRTISREEVLDCRSSNINGEYGLPNLDQLPGYNIAEKKAIYGGFDITELPIFAQQRLNTNMKRRRLEALGFEDQITDLFLTLITLQRRYRREISKQNNISGIGPDVLRCLEEKIPLCIDDNFVNKEINEAFCHGLLWQATNECHLWWHRLGEIEGGNDANSSSI